MVWVMRQTVQDMVMILPDQLGGPVTTVELVDDVVDAGRPVDPSRVPRHWKLETKRKTLPDIFLIQDAFTVVSGRFRRLLEAHEIGACQFFDITIRDRKDQIREGDYSIFNVVDYRNTLIPEASNVEAREHGRLGPIYFLQSRYDPDFVLEAEAGSGLDLWREEKEIDCLYFSDRLIRACKAEKIRGLRPYRATLASDGAPSSAS